MIEAMYALNFYSKVVAEQLRTQRKTATIRLGDKSAKYRKGMVVQVLVGVRFGVREKIFDAVIDKVEVKTLGELSPREIEHDNPEIRRTEDGDVPVAALQPRGDAGRHGHGDPLLADRSRAEPLGARQTRFRIGVPKSSGARRAAPQASHSTANAELKGASHAGHRRSIGPPQAGHSSDTSASKSSNQRRTEPHSRQNAAQSPSTLRRSSRSHSEALPIGSDCNPDR